MHEMTKSHLENAFSGESMANMRYKLYSEKASEEGYPSVSLLFEGIAFAELVHARNHNKRLPEEGDDAVGEAPFGIGSTLDNLEKGIEGENFEIKEMYPAYKEVAELQGEGAARISFNWALEAEKVHADFFEEAKESLEEDGSYDLEEIAICEQCGYTTEGEPPEKCPICGAKKDRFKVFTQD